MTHEATSAPGLTTRPWTRLGWPLLLALVCVAVLGSRVYVDFERVRARLVTTARPAEGAALTVPLRNQDRLAGLPVAIIARIRGDAEPLDITISLDGRQLVQATVPADREIRIDTSVDALAPMTREISITGSRPGWSLTYLETATIHGYAGPPLNLVVAPDARGGDRIVPVWLLLPLFAVLVMVRPRWSWPQGWARYVYRFFAGAMLVLFAVALATPVFSRFTLLLSLQTFLFGMVVLYAEPLARGGNAFLRRALPSDGCAPELGPLPGWREVLLAAAGVTVVVCSLLHEQVRNLDSVPDFGDPLFSMWRMAWVQHQLIADPRHLFDANIFYPARATLTYSDSTILPAITAWPLVAIGFHPVTAYNLLFISGFVLSGVATYVLARSFGWGRAAAWISALVFALYPFRIDHYSHLELQMAQWMPLAVLGVHRVMATGRWAYAAVAAAAIAAQWYSSMYYALFLMVFVTAFAIVLAKLWKQWRRLPQAALAIGVGACLALPLGLAYSRAQSERGDRPVQTVAALSATPGDYLQPTARSAWYAGMNPKPGQSERQLFPGFAPLALAIAGAWPPWTSTRVAALFSGIVAFDGSLGMNGLVYPWLYEYAFPYRSIRVPARYAMLVGLSLALLSGAALERWRRRTPRRRMNYALAVTAVSAVVVIDAWPALHLVPVWRQPPPIYGSLGAGSGAVLMEYPLNPEAQAFSENIPYEYFSIWHLTPMVNGYSGFSSPGYAGLADSMKDFPRGNTLPALQAMGVTHISVVCALDATFGPYGVPQPNPEKCAATVGALDSEPRVRPVVRAEWEGEPALLYEIRK